MINSFVWEGTVFRAGLLCPAGSVWVLDFVQERSHNSSPSGFESMFIKLGDRETNEEITGRRSNRGEQLWLPINLIGKK